MKAEFREGETGVDEGAHAACLVLIADDDADGRSFIASELQRSGFHVIEVSDGTELVARFAAMLSGAEGARPDVVVSDVNMPRCDGLTATAAILRAAPGTPVVLVTAFDDSASRSAARQVGAAAMLGKPVDPARLAHLVRSLVGQGSTYEPRAVV